MLVSVQPAVTTEGHSSRASFTSHSTYCLNAFTRLPLRGLSIDRARCYRRPLMTSPMVVQSTALVHSVGLTLELLVSKDFAVFLKSDQSPRAVRSKAFSGYPFSRTTCSNVTLICPHLCCSSRLGLLKHLTYQLQEGQSTVENWQRSV
jgi:hypothetical protein